MADDKNKSEAKKPDESKREKFVRLANLRGGAAVSRINMISTLANKSAYEFTEADCKALEQVIVNAANDAIGKMRDALAGKTVAAKDAPTIIS